MGYTTVKECLNKAKIGIEEAVEELDILNRHPYTHGWDEFTEDYRDRVTKAHQSLLDIRNLLGRR